MTRFLRAILGRLDAFRDSQSGHVAVIFALTLIPVVGLTGAAIDYTRASSVRSAMQAALDATALAIAKEAASLSASELNDKANAYFKAAFNRPEIPNFQVGATYSSVGGSSVTVAASGSVPTLFMGLMGINDIAIGSTSKSAWGNVRLRVALVLDTTGSMASAGKMSALKSATKDLLNQLQSASIVNGDVYVSIIPFSKNVNAGSFNHSASWIDWTDWQDEPAILKASKPSNWSNIGPGSSCPFSNSSHGFRCTTGPTRSTITSTIPSSGSYSGYICPSTDTGGEIASKIGIIYNGCYNSVPTTTTTIQTICSGWSCSCGSLSDCLCSGSGSGKVCERTMTTTGAPYTHTWITNPRSTWNGCITDRGATSGPSQDYDRKSTAPDTGIPASLFPAEQNAYCSPEIMGLNYNWSAMKSMVDNFYPLGATNQPIGLVWGWQSLVGGGPLTAPAKDANYIYNEAIVLMSDGLNTLNRWNGNGSSTNTAVDQRMHESSVLGTCANIKASGITIYTIHVNTDGDPMSTLLRNCASSPDKFWMVTSASGIGTVFNAIGTNLTKLRLAL